MKNEEALLKTQEQRTSARDCPRVTRAVQRGVRSNGGRKRKWRGKKEEIVLWSTCGVASVHSERGKGHRPEGEFRVRGVAAGGRRQDARVLTALQCGNRDGTDHRYG